MRRWFIIFVIVLLGLMGGTYILTRSRQSLPPARQPRTATKTPEVTFNKLQYSLSDPTSLWVIVNKRRPLQPKTYVPSDLVVPKVPLRVPGNESMQLRAAAASALQTMFQAAKQQGINLMLSSGYRSFTYQTNLYGNYVRTQGQAKADTFSARPGYSEHQTGLAADIEPLNQKCDVDPCFGTLPEGHWLATHAYEYGFVIRYTAANQAFTGYEPEPWHIRYVGVTLAIEIHRAAAASLEQFFGLAAAPTY